MTYPSYEMDYQSLRMFVDIDRYRYSATKPYFTAWLGPKPDAISERYPACEEFLEQNKDTLLFGEGFSEQDAYKDLCRKLAEQGVSDPITDGPSSSRILCVFVDGVDVYKIGSDEYKQWIASNS